MTAMRFQGRDEDCVVRKEERVLRHGSDQPVQQVDVELMGLGRHIVVVLFLCGQAEHPGERGLGSVTVRDRTAKSCDNPFRESTTSGVLHTRRHIGR